MSKATSGPALDQDLAGPTGTRREDPVVRQLDWQASSKVSWAAG
jgi:hypothetical protein